MHCTVKMTEDLYWVGASDRRLALFESVYPIPRGVSYNAYVLLDEKTVLLDTVDQSVAGQFFENLAHVLGGRPLDYIVVHHMEPDHGASIEEILIRWPEVKVISTACWISLDFTLPDGSERRLVVCKKISQTPTAYPRNGGKIAKKPL